MLTSPLSLGSLAGASLASLVDSCALAVAGTGAVNAEGDVEAGASVGYEGPCRLTAVRRDVQLAKLAGAEVDADATLRLPLLDAATRAAFERGVDAIRGTVTQRGVTRPVTVAGIRPGRIATVLYVRLGAPVDP